MAKRKITFVEWVRGTNPAYVPPKREKKWFRRLERAAKKMDRDKRSRRLK